MEDVGIRVPAHFAIERDVYVIDCPFPAAFDEEKRSWLLEDGAISWDDVIARWRARGPMNVEYVRTLQRGYFNPKAIKGLVEEHLSGRRNRPTDLWLLLIFELWHRNFLETRFSEKLTSWHVQASALPLTRQ